MIARIGKQRAKADGSSLAQTITFSSDGSFRPNHNFRQLGLLRWNSGVKLNYSERKNRNFGKHTDRKKGSIRANDKYLNTGEGLKPRTHLTRIVRAKIRWISIPKRRKEKHFLNTYHFSIFYTTWKYLSDQKRHSLS